MKAVIQRVKYSRLSVDGKVISEIGKGLTVYFGVESNDDELITTFFAKKIARRIKRRLRIKKRNFNS